MGTSNIVREIFICRGTGCQSSNSTEIYKTLVESIQANNLSSIVKVKATGCHGFCQMGPIVKIQPDNTLYVKVQEGDVKDIVEQHLIENKPVERLLYQEPETGKYIKNMEDIPFYSEQKLRIVLQNCGRIDPENIEEYIAVGGYKSLKKVLTEFTPSEVIDQIKRSRLRGRGGAGFPTGQKWSLCSKASGNPKYLICNGDEGDPGAFMDRSIFESDPQSVIEGMIIAAYAIGANFGYIYVRTEYPLAIQRIKIALGQAKEKGFIGDNI
ncbi:MAG: NAD(P)H-dependent oxidoreductase subunit E, partial [Candidatus Helarchaeota archaeon]|nr:NAD(P)H-dependent oxidoreductase subunit E [Candidatus Helarchaeota archaeon]